MDRRIRVTMLVAPLMMAVTASTTLPASESPEPTPNPYPEIAPIAAPIAVGPQPTPQITAAPILPADPEPTRPITLGSQSWPRQSNGKAVPRATPADLVERELPPRPLLPDPESDSFESTISAIPADVLKRSTWRTACPVHHTNLRYLTVTFWGFDDRPHTGEIIVHKNAARDIVGVFRRLYDARFPIEEMRVISNHDLYGPATGDQNITTGFECRPVSGKSRPWSRHSYGYAIDINPFHNPYVKGSLISPELSESYTNRRWRRPGMIYRGDAVHRAFSAIGWSWGGSWSSSDDWMHFYRR